MLEYKARGWAEPGGDPSTCVLAQLPVALQLGAAGSWGGTLMLGMADVCLPARLQGLWQSRME